MKKQNKDSNDSSVSIVQMTKFRWQLESSKGHIIKNDIFLSTRLEAENYVKNYVSSFTNWDYEVIPKEKK